MQTSNAEQGSKSKDFIWYLLGEYSLSDFIPDPEKGDTIKAGLVSQMVRGLGIPDQYVDNIEGTLSSFARKVISHFKQGWVELPGRIRIFCQKKIIDEEMHGGWGYFVIERPGDSATTDRPNRNFPEPFHLMDIFFYEEDG